MNILAKCLQYYKSNYSNEMAVVAIKDMNLFNNEGVSW